MRTANDRKFATGLLAGTGTKPGQPVVFCKHEHPYVVVKVYRTRAAFVAGTVAKDGDIGWTTMRRAQALAKRIGAAVVEF